MCEMSPLQKWFSQTACLSCSQGLNHSPVTAGQKTHIWLIFSCSRLRLFPARTENPSPNDAGFIPIAHGYGHASQAAPASFLSSFLTSNSSSHIVKQHAKQSNSHAGHENTVQVI